MRRDRKTDLGMAQRNQDFRNTLLISDRLGIAVQCHCRRPGLVVVEDLDIEHGSRGALGLHTERLEDGLFACPTSSEGRRRGWLRVAVRDLKRREVAGHEGRVRRRHGGDELCASESDTDQQGE